MTGSASFHSLGPHKIELIHHTLQWGLELVITDVDALVLREPFEYMVRRSDGALPDARSPAHARMTARHRTIAGALAGCRLPDDERPPIQHDGRRWPRDAPGEG